MSLAGANAPVPVVFWATIVLYSPALPPVDRSSPPPLPARLARRVVGDGHVDQRDRARDSRCRLPALAELKAIVVLVSVSVPVDSCAMPPPAGADVLLTSDEFEIVTRTHVVDAAALRRWPYST